MAPPFFVWGNLGLGLQSIADHHRIPDVKHYRFSGEKIIATNIWYMADVFLKSVSWYQVWWIFVVGIQLQNGGFKLQVKYPPIYIYIYILIWWDLTLACARMLINPNPIRFNWYYIILASAGFVIWRRWEGSMRHLWPQAFSIHHQILHKSPWSPTQWHFLNWRLQVLYSSPIPSTIACCDGVAVLPVGKCCLDEEGISWINCSLGLRPKTRPI